MKNFNFIIFLHLNPFKNFLDANKVFPIFLPFLSPAVVKVSFVMKSKVELVAVASRTAVASLVVLLMIDGVDDDLILSLGVIVGSMLPLKAKLTINNKESSKKNKNQPT